VDVSWYQRAREFKSPSHVVGAFLLRSRETLRAENRRLREERKQLDEKHERDVQQAKRQQQRIEELEQQCAQWKQQRDQALQSVNLPEDPPVATHGFGARMISLAVNLAKSVGFRGAERVLKLVFEWLGVDQRVPSRTTIRTWLQRLGIAELEQPLQPNEDLVVMLDHSNQIGTEKVLVALAVNASALPEQGTALTHEHVRVLEVKPGSSWKTEDMEQAYQELAKKHGVPRATLTDGATELCEGAKCLKTQRADTLQLRDFKHYAANVMKSLIGNDDRFKEVSSQIGTTRSSIQQTELAHLTPPGAKPKARFMNLARTIRWMTLIVWLLNHPEAKARAGITDERMQLKLGWVQEYADEIAVWQECQEVVSVSLTFINEQYLFRGASAALRTVIGDSLKHDTSKELAKRLIDFVRDGEEQLREGERLPMSTEILESSFGLYKQLERQHSKSGFTSLLACFPALLHQATPESVTSAFRQVSSDDVKAWVKKHFATTVTSRRQSAYAEHKTALKCATLQQPTT
jgi:hypothetical protein